MLTYITRRLAYMVVTLLVVSIITFIIIQLPPGDFISSYVGELASLGEVLEQDEIDALRARYGLGQPMYVQYIRWFGNLLQGNLGRSLRWNKPVLSLIKDRLPWSFSISMVSLAFVWIIGLPIGVYSATNQYSMPDYIATFLGFVGLGVPNFLIALIALWVYFQSTGDVIVGLMSPEYLMAKWSLPKLFDLLKHLWLPALITGMAGTAGLIRTMRANLLDELPKPYVTVARARGVGRVKLLYKYPLRIAINPVISTIGYTLPALMEGEVLVSIVLGLPTLAPVLLNALLQQDMLLASSVIMIEAVLVLVGTLISDILLAIVDPRIRGSI